MRVSYRKRKGPFLSTNRIRIVVWRRGSAPSKRGKAPLPHFLSQRGPERECPTRSWFRVQPGAVPGSPRASNP